MTYFKVVERTSNPNIFKSVIYRPPLYYRLNKITTAKIGGLLVFDKVECAYKGCINFEKKRTVFEVKCEGLIKLGSCLNIWYSWTEPDMIKAWNASIVTGLVWPVGTLAFKQVKLIREVTRSEDINYATTS